MTVSAIPGADTSKYARSDGTIGETSVVSVTGSGAGGAVTVATPGSIAAVGTFTRPADTTAYAIGDLIANSTTAGSVAPLTIPVARAVNLTAVLRRLRLKATGAGMKGAIIRVHLFKNSPTVAVGDNGALNVSETYAFTESVYLGYQDITLVQLTSDNIAKGFASIDTIVEPATGTVNIFALLEARSVFTPTSAGVFDLVVEALRD